MFRLGIENLLRDQKLIKRLREERVALVAHPASVDQNLNHSLDLLVGSLKKSLTCAFGPQHGLRGEKQDNMIESSDYRDPKHGIPIFSLYGTTRRPTKEMLNQFDVVLVDLQDLGCRIYTFLTTLFYLIEDCAAHGKSLYVLDRPNPIGRPIEGNLLEPAFHSFVGIAPMPMRHGLTLGEAAKWYIQHKSLKLDFHIVKMSGYKPLSSEEFGWPKNLSWVNPSPNAPNLNMARVYPGSVMIEGTNFSEGRGTTRPLELIGLPEINSEEWIRQSLKIIGSKSEGFKLRPCYFEPTFHKFSGQLCSGIQVHVDKKYYKHKFFKPYRLFASIFKAAHQLKPDFDIWKKPPYEYEHTKSPIDLISGSVFLRNWVESKSAKMGELNTYLAKDEKQWEKIRKPFLIY